MIFLPARALRRRAVIFLYRAQVSNTSPINKKDRINRLQKLFRLIAAAPPLAAKKALIVVAQRPMEAVPIC